MSFYNHLSKSFALTYKQRTPALRERVSKWRTMPVVVRVDRPLNPARAHALGYKAKKEFIVARVRIAKGNRRRKRPDLGRKPGKNRKSAPPGKSLQWRAEQRASRRFPNLKLINSYYVGEDGQFKFFEVVLRDLN